MRHQAHFETRLENRSALPRVNGSRIAALDGLRGVLMLIVLLGHDLGEVPHGVRGFAFAWVAVTAFFVLSGFVVTRQLLEIGPHRIQFAPYTVRRLFRTLPVYLPTVIGAYVCFGWIRAPWQDPLGHVPLWSYLTFTQPFFMVAGQSPGSRWLQPTWTLAVQEQFYLLAPLVVLAVPRRRLAAVLASSLVLPAAFRAWVVASGALPAMASLVLIPAVADSFICGMLAAVLIASPGIDWRRCDWALRAAAPALLFSTIGLKIIGGEPGLLFSTFSGLTVSLAATAFILGLVRGAPEAARFHAPGLQFLGRISFSTYLTHLPVLGLLHGLILGNRPDMGTPAQLALTLLALPLSLLAGWACTKLIEEPMTAYGRAWLGRQREAEAAPPGLATA